MTYGRFEEQLERLCSVRQGLTSGIAVPCSLYTLPDAIMTKCKGQRTYSALPLRRTERQAAAFACFARSMASIMIRSEEHTSELQSLMRISYAVFCLKKKKPNIHNAFTT